MERCPWPQGQSHQGNGPVLDILCIHNGQHVDILVDAVQNYHELAVLLIRPGHMPLEAVVGAQPHKILPLGVVPRCYPKEVVLCRIPRSVVSALLQSLQIDLEGRQGQDDVVLGEPKVVHIPTERGLEPGFGQLLAISANLVKDNLLGCIVAVATGFVTETKHVAYLWVDFWVGCKRGRQHLSVKVVPANGLQCSRVECVGWTVLLARKLHAPPEDDIGVGRGADIDCPVLMSRP